MYVRVDLGIKLIYKYNYTAWMEFTVANPLTILLNLKSASRNKDTRSLALSTADTTPWMGEPRVFMLETAVLAVSRACSTVVSADTGVSSTGVWVD